MGSVGDAWTEKKDICRCCLSGGHRYTLHRPPEVCGAPVLQSSGAGRHTEAGERGRWRTSRAEEGHVDTPLGNQSTSENGLLFAV